MANSVDLDQTAPIGAVCSRSTLFASILNSSVMLGNYLQQTTSAVDIFRCFFFLCALRVKLERGMGTGISLSLKFNPLVALIKGALTRYGKVTWESAHNWNLIILCLLIAWGLCFNLYGAFELLCTSLANL